VPAAGNGQGAAAMAQDHDGPIHVVLNKPFARDELLAAVRQTMAAAAG